jgi:hypothetical protein
MRGKNNKTSSRIQGMVVGLRNSRDERRYDLNVAGQLFCWHQLARSTYFVVWSRQALWPQLQMTSAVLASPSQ